MSVKASRGVQTAAEEPGTVAVVGVRDVTDGVHDGFGFSAMVEPCSKSMVFSSEKP